MNSPELQSLAVTVSGRVVRELYSVLENSSPCLDRLSITLIPLSLPPSHHITSDPSPTLRRLIQRRMGSSDFTPITSLVISGQLVGDASRWFEQNVKDLTLLDNEDVWADDIPTGDNDEGEEEDGNGEDVSNEDESDMSD